MKSIMFGLSVITTVTPEIAMAQQSASAAPAAPRAPEQVEGVTVRGQQGFRSSIDRRSYNVLDDLQTSTGSVGDALRNVPSVQVDVEGNVTLRGESVTILVDGRPSALFRGDQAAAIQSFPADQIERVEVITNPSAQMSAEGSGGIINLVTKKTFRAGYSGMARTNVGSQGQANGGVNMAYQSAKTTAAISGNMRREVRKTETAEDRTRIDPATGLAADTRQDTVSKNVQENALVRAGVDYDKDDKTRFSVEVSARRSRSAAFALDHQENENALGILSRVNDRTTDGAQSSRSIEAETSFRKRFSGDDHELTGEVSREWSDDSRVRTVLNAARLAPVGDSYEAYDSDEDQTQTQVRLDYNRPILGDSRLKIGYLLDLNDHGYDNLGRRGASLDTLTVDPSLTYDYDFRREIHAFYATYQRPFGDLTVLPGLRLEHTKTDVGVPSQAVAREASYGKIYPSLHLAYELSGTQRLSASYSVRIQRPSASDLNPFRIYVDPFNYREGNPNLAPQQTHAFEAGWQRRSGNTYYLATAYYRESSGGISNVTKDIGNGVFLTTRENLRKSRSGGLELVANSRLTRTLRYNVSGNVFWNELDGSNLGLSDARSAFALGGRANLNWQVTPKDFVQVNGSLNSKRVTAQGYQAGSGVLNLGYRRKVNDRISFIATAQDVLKTANQRTVIDTPSLTGITRREPVQRALFIGLTWTFGAVQRQQQRDPDFEFGGDAGD